MFPNPMLTKSSKKLNAELAEKGYVVISGRVNKQYFMERTCYGADKKESGKFMAVYKEEKTNTWRVLYRYTDWNGERKQTQKRGFKTKREAQSWEREQLNKLGGDLDMNFKSFVEHYSEDMQTRLKEKIPGKPRNILLIKSLFHISVS